MATAVQIVAGLPKLVTITPGKSTDIGDTSFSAANNQSSPADVTGLSFSNASVRAFSAIVSVKLLATSNKYSVVFLNGIQNGSDWQMSPSYIGDDSGIIFSITTSGQIQYTSPNFSGFTSLNFNFRAITVS